MKTKHLRVLEAHQGINASLRRESDILRLGEREETTPKCRLTKEDDHYSLRQIAESELLPPPTIALVGASITRDLQKFPGVWNQYLSPFGALNLGIGGDRVEHIQWRMRNMVLPKTVGTVVIHAGTNNVGRSKPEDIANGIMVIGVVKI